MQLIPKKNFQKTIDGKKVDLFNLKNSSGMLCQITNYGGRVVSLWTKDKNGDFNDIVLGYDLLEDYLNADEMFFGAIIGRYGNRIANGEFKLEGETYCLEKNDAENHLHGGSNGFHNVVWEANLISESKLELNYLSKSLESGYPGNVHVTVIYEVTDENELKINYKATTDQSTIINLTHHSYFNLLGAGRGTINNHNLQINASSFTPVDEHMIPTGKLISVKQTPFDFTVSKLIGSDLNNDHKQLRLGSGYDHNFVLDGTGLKKAAVVSEPNSGRVMEVYTTEPGIQFYGGNHLNTKTAGKNNLFYDSRTAFCLETQHFPDSPNQRTFPFTILKPGETYASVCIYRFKYYMDM